MLGTAKPVQEQKPKQKQGQKMVILNCVRSAHSIRVHQVGVAPTSYLVNKTLATGQNLSWSFSSPSQAFKFAHFLGVPQKEINKVIQNQLSLF